MLPSRMAPVGSVLRGTGGGLCFTAGGDGAVVLTTSVRALPVPDLLVSRGDGRWRAVSSGVPVELPAGESAWFRASAIRNAADVGFRVSGVFSVSGDPMWLVDPRGLPTRPLTEYAFYSLFRDCTGLVSAANLDLGRGIPDGAVNCYEYMFYGCTSLEDAPRLPSETLARGCYANMFFGCSMLMSPPAELPADYPARGCYTRMFAGCSSMVAAPEICATKGLTMPAMTGMFSRCSSLTSVSVRFTSWPIQTDNWLLAVPAAGTFHCPAALGTSETIVRGPSNCPEGWTVVNDVV